MSNNSAQSAGVAPAEAMFSEARRDEVRQRLLSRAEEDDHIVAAAVTGSRAEGHEDRYSDIDLFFGVHDADELSAVIEDWSTFLYDQLGAVHHFNLVTSAATYRAFILADGLQVDLGFARSTDFGPIGDGAFDVVFGATAPRKPLTPNTDFLIGMAWHHVQHARTAIERGALWQAEHWISAARDVALSLASIRYGLPHSYARGAEALPLEVTAPLEDTLVRHLSVADTRRALSAATEAIRRELSLANPELSAKLQPLLDWAGGSSTTTR